MFLWYDYIIDSANWDVAFPDCMHNGLMMRLAFVGSRPLTGRTTAR
jgi:hypothetical protein